MIGRREQKDSDKPWWANYMDGIPRLNVSEKVLVTVTEVSGEKEAVGSSGKGGHGLDAGPL